MLEYWIIIGVTLIAIGNWIELKWMRRRVSDLERIISQHLVNDHPAFYRAKYPHGSGGN